MDLSFDLLGNALVSGLLLGGFYAAVTIGVSISFGMLDIVNIAHPAFIILGSYTAYIANSVFGFDPILSSIVLLPAFYLLGRGDLSRLRRVLRTPRRCLDPRAGVLFRHPVYHRSHPGAGLRGRLPAGRRTLYRAKPAYRRNRSAVAAAGSVASCRWP